jgi:hypothetical protein
MWRSRFHLAISLAACSSGPPKPDAYCGTGGAPAVGIVAMGTGVTLTYGNFSASANGDCGPTSITIGGTTSDATPGFFTLCVPHPENLPGGLAIGTDVVLVDTTGPANGCAWKIDPNVPPTGTVSTTGECKNGTSSAGFAMTVTGNAQLKPAMCAMTTSVPVTISGTVAVQ